MNIGSPTLRRIDMMGAGVLIGMTALAFFAGLQPLIHARHERRQLLNSLSESQARRQQLEKQASSLNTELDTIKEDLRSSQITLESAGSLNSRLMEITDVAERHDLKVEVRQPGQPAYQTRFGIVPITMQGRGGYADLSGFLHDLNGTYRDTGVRTFEITGGEGEADEEPRWSMELSWYVLPLDRP